MSKPVIRIIIADDHLIVANALRDIVNKMGDFTVDHVYPNGHDVVECLRRGYPADIILTDINMPGMNGFETGAWIRINRPDTKMIAVTMYDNEYLFLELLDLGFGAVLTKNISARELELAIHTVYNGELYTANLTSPKILSILKNPGKRLKTTGRKFTEKENAILKLLVTDLSYKEIASALSISIRSVEAYKEAFCEKFAVQTRIGITSYAVKNGLVLV